METLLSKSEVAELAPCTEREVRLRMRQGEYAWRSVPRARNHGKFEKKIILERLPAELQQKYFAQQISGPHNWLTPPPTGRPPLAPAALDSRLRENDCKSAAGAPTGQLPLPLDAAGSFALLPPAAQPWLLTCFEGLMSSTCSTGMAIGNGNSRAKSTASSIQANLRREFTTLTRKPN